MARFPRVVAVGIPHHVTQRGNARQFLLTNDVERIVYLALLRQAAELHGLCLLGYCLMSNHVHLVVVPHQPQALALALKQTHGRYASYWNASRQSTGHVWQGRYYSCPLDAPHLWQALRYTELNPVRAGIVPDPEAWPWSSPPSIVADPQLVFRSPWSLGSRAGARPNGASTCKTGRRKANAWRSAAAPTPGALSANHSSSNN